MPDLLSGFFGAVLGAIAAWLAAERANKHNTDLKEWEGRRENDGVLGAVDLELTICAEEYFRGMGKLVDDGPLNQPLYAQFEITNEYTLAYKQNLHVIGRLENEALRKLIIETHLQWAFLFEALFTNTRILKAEIEWELRRLQEKDPQLKELSNRVVENLQVRLKRMPEMLKRRQAQCKELTLLQTKEIADYRARHQLRKPEWFDFYGQ